MWGTPETFKRTWALTQSQLRVYDIFRPMARNTLSIFYQRSLFRGMNEADSLNANWKTASSFLWRPGGIPSLWGSLIFVFISLGQSWGLITIEPWYRGKATLGAKYATYWCMYLQKPTGLYFNTFDLKAFHWTEKPILPFTGNANNVFVEEPKEK